MGNFENNNFWFKESELKNNNFNPELEAFLKDNILAKEEADILNDMFEENKAWIILVSKQNLRKLRESIWSNSKVNYISSSDKNIINNISQTENTNSNKDTEPSYNLEPKNNHIDSEWYLTNVTKIRLDEIVWPSEMIKFSIKLSQNSLYNNNMDWNTYNVIWWKDKISGKQTYIFQEWPKIGERVMISNGDKLWEYIETQNNNLAPETSQRPIQRPEILTKDNEELNQDNQEFIEWLDLNNHYKEIAKEFISKLNSNEILTKNTPIALVSHQKKEMAYIINWETIIVPVLLWKNWVTNWWYIPNDRKTPIWKIHRFDPDLSILANSPDWDASNSQKSKTVKSASLQSELSIQYWWRYFHWVAQYRIDWRNNWMWTWWCVWVDVNTIRKMYQDIQRNGKWYWYVS